MKKRLKIDRPFRPPKEPYSQQIFPEADNLHRLLYHLGPWLAGLSEEKSEARQLPCVADSPDRSPFFRIQSAQLAPFYPKREAKRDARRTPD
jgi:hypothetical protein